MWEPAATKHSGIGGRLTGTSLSKLCYNSRQRYFPTDSNREVLASRAKRFEYSTVLSGTLAIANGAEGTVEGQGLRVETANFFDYA